MSRRMYYKEQLLVQPKLINSGEIGDSIKYVLDKDFNIEIGKTYLVEVSVDENHCQAGIIVPVAEEKYGFPFYDTANNNTKMIEVDMNNKEITLFASDASEKDFNIVKVYEL